MPELLEKSLGECPVVDKNGYSYFVHPLTDGIPLVKPELLSEVVDRIAAVSRMDCDIIVTAEAMGIPLATALSVKTGIPFNVIRKRAYGLEGEVAIGQSTGYSSSRLYINGIKRGDRVMIVDDVLSTGGTLRPCLVALREMGVEVTEVVVVVNKGDADAAISEEFGVPVRSLVRVRMEGGKVVVG
ncbi:MAG: adenine phosphoribosyltransferase [Thermoplasmata archaeon HGW-Thermoplasmata-1]|nr:MAG: adenine phosphoribosyltransferase [Thermoplasmata archaeon HGW-Thermoplasmata-1]